MIIQAALVRELRERTGVGMMECKKALEETKGDLEKAIEELRKAGKAKADKKSGRTASEGKIAIELSKDHKKAVIVEVNCETDFVARDENFSDFLKSVVHQALQHDFSTLESLMKEEKSDGQTLEQAREVLVAKVGENIQVRRVELIKSSEKLGFYVHSNRIGVVVELNGGNSELAKNIAMHIIANNPLVISRDAVSEELIAKEREIFSAQSQISGKPAGVLEKMIEGRINKFLDEVSLLSQPYMKDTTVSVAQLLKNENASILRYVRFALGEGIVKEIK